MGYVLDVFDIVDNYAEFMLYYKSREMFYTLF